LTVSGIGDEKSIKNIEKVSETFNVPTVTDIQ
jgi:3-deoxy-D-manno-octulosonic acid (KDO) 8-phosphate synthase